MTLKRKTVASLCAALLVLGFAAGCSKKESTETSTGGNSNSGSESGSKSGGDSGSKSGGNSGGNDLPNLGNFDECISASSAYLQIVAAPAMMMGGASKEEVDKMKKDLEDLKGKIPAELKSDMEVVGKAYSEFLEALANNSIMSDEVQKASENLDKGEVKKAQENIDEYFKKNCG